MKRAFLPDIKEYAHRQLLDGRRLDAVILAQEYGCRKEKALTALLSLLREGRADLAAGGGFVIALSRLNKVIVRESIDSSDDQEVNL